MPLASGDAKSLKKRSTPAGYLKGISDIQPSVKLFQIALQYGLSIALFVLLIPFPLSFLGPEVLVLVWDGAFRLASFAALILAGMSFAFTKSNPASSARCSVAATVILLLLLGLLMNLSFLGVPSDSYHTPALAIVGVPLLFCVLIYQDLLANPYKSFLARAVYALPQFSQNFVLFASMVTVAKLSTLLFLFWYHSDSEQFLNLVFLTLIESGVVLLYIYLIKEYLLKTGNNTKENFLLQVIASALLVAAVQGASITLAGRVNYEHIAMFCLMFCIFYVALDPAIYKSKIVTLISVCSFIVAYANMFIANFAPDILEHLAKPLLSEERTQLLTAAPGLILLLSLLGYIFGRIIGLVVDQIFRKTNTVVRIDEGTVEAAADEILGREGFTIDSASNAINLAVFTGRFEPVERSLSKFHKHNQKVSRALLRFIKIYLFSARFIYEDKVTIRRKGSSDRPNRSKTITEKQEMRREILHTLGSRKFKSQTLWRALRHNTFVMRLVNKERLDKHSPDSFWNTLRRRATIAILAILIILAFVSRSVPPGAFRGALSYIGTVYDYGLFRRNVLRLNFVMHLRNEGETADSEIDFRIIGWIFEYLQYFQHTNGDVAGALNKVQPWVAKIKNRNLNDRRIQSQSSAILGVHFNLKGMHDKAAANWLDAHAAVQEFAQKDDYLLHAARSMQLAENKAAAAGLLANRIQQEYGNYEKSTAALCALLFANEAYEEILTQLKDVSEREPAPPVQLCYMAARKEMEEDFDMRPFTQSLQKKNLYEDNLPLDPHEVIGLASFGERLMLEATYAKAAHVFYLVFSRSSIEEFGILPPPVHFRSLAYFADAIKKVNEANPRDYRAFLWKAAYFHAYGDVRTAQEHAQAFQKLRPGREMNYMRYLQTKNPGTAMPVR